jgi:hypothetical protein
MTNTSPDDPPPSAWASLGPVEQAREWEAFRPGTFEQVFELAKHEADLRQMNMDIAARHERRLDYISVAMQAVALVFALASVAIMALTAKYYADHNAASDGVKIFGFGAASIVAGFLGVNATPIVGRMWSRKRAERTRESGEHTS